MTGQQLKNSILQMAVQGKLVPQDPNDEPASVLLERIRAEKEQLIKEGKIKKEKNSSIIFRGADNLPYEKVGKNEPVCIADEVPFEIPESWEWARLGSLFLLQAGKNISASKISEVEFPDSYPCYGGNGIRGYVNVQNHNGDYPIIGRQGALCGNIKRATGKFYATEHAVCVSTFAHTDITWVCFFLTALNLNQYATATAQPGLAVANINRVLFPVPPIAEQERITTRLLKVLPMADAYGVKEKALQDYNKDFPVQLKKSILQEAVQGKLVPQNPSDEPASVLLERIRAEKQKLIAEGKIKKDKHESVIFRRDNSHYEKRGFEEVCIDDEIPFELPNGWCWCRFSTICYKLTDGSHNPPPKRANGFRVISARNIKNGRILFTDEDRLCDQNGFNKENPRTQISKGDVILGIIGGSIGNTAIYGYDEPVIAQRSIAIFGSLINNKYMKLLLDSPLFQQQFNSKSNGTAQGGIYLGELANMLVPLPPVNEQNRILASISSLENKIVTM